MKVEGLCDTCENIEDCSEWLNILKSDNTREVKQGWRSRGIRTITLVYDCPRYEKRDKNKIVMEKVY